MKPSEIIRARGWCQGAYGVTKDGRKLLDRESAAQDDGPVCLTGALGSACYNKEHGCIMWTEYDRMSMDFLHANNVGVLPTWNDVNGRTVEEVLEALERAGL